MVRVGVVILAFSLASFAAGRAQSIRDSAGVRIVESRAQTWNTSQRWQLSSTPSLSIGLEDGDEPYLLSRVYSALRLPNGRIVIGDSGSGELRFFDTSGKFVLAAGRRGQGPGEFHEYSSIILCLLPEGELFAADAGANRAHIFSLAGEYKRTIRFQYERGSSTPGFRACLADGTLLMRTVPSALLQGDPGTLIRSTMQYFRYTADGRPLAKLAEVPDRTRYVNQFGNITHYPFVPFSPESQGTVGARTFYLNHSGSSEVECRNADGTLRQIIRWQAPRVRTAAVYQRYVDTGLAAESEQRRPQYAAFFAKKLPVPRFVPVVGQVAIDALEYLWAKRYQLPWDKTSTYDIFSPTGTWLGEVSAPPNVDVYQIGRDFILGRHRDVLGIERIVIHSLDRRTTRPQVGR